MGWLTRVRIDCRRVELAAGHLGEGAERPLEVALVFGTGLEGEDRDAALEQAPCHVLGGQSGRHLLTQGHGLGLGVGVGDHDRDPTRSADRGATVPQEATLGQDDRVEDRFRGIVAADHLVGPAAQPDGGFLERHRMRDLEALIGGAEVPEEDEAGGREAGVDLEIVQNLVDRVGEVAGVLLHRPGGVENYADGHRPGDRLHFLGRQVSLDAAGDDGGDQHPVDALGLAAEGRDLPGVEQGVGNDLLISDAGLQLLPEGRAEPLDVPGLGIAADPVLGLPGCH
jgi:hypothetical protein